MLSRNAGFDQSANELPMPALNSTLPFAPSWTWCLGSPTGYTRRRGSRGYMNCVPINIGCC
jgi:hypothetical protein